jgi:hypothetical protein
MRPQRLHHHHGNDGGTADDQPTIPQQLTLIRRAAGGPVVPRSVEGRIAFGSGLDLATVLLQWSVGGLFFLWVTGERRQVGIGYGWLLRGVYGLMALAAAVAGVRYHPVVAREASSLAVGLAAGAAFVVSWRRRRAGVLHQREQSQARSARITEMTGIDREAQHFDETVAEFPPRLDLIAPAVGMVGLVAAGIDAGSPAVTQVVRVVVGAFPCASPMRCSSATVSHPAGLPGPAARSGARSPGSGRSRPQSCCFHGWGRCSRHDDDSWGGMLG